MAERFINPITTAFTILDSYKESIIKNLQANQISPQHINKIIGKLEIDRGVIISLNREYEQGKTGFRQFCSDNGLVMKLPELMPKVKHLYVHQEKAIQAIQKEKPTVISTGTGSGKTETFLVPIIDHCIKNREPGLKAIIIYPMNALANDQLSRIADYTKNTDVTFGVFIGSTPEAKNDDSIELLSQNHIAYKADMRANPPDILVTNYVMLERMLTRDKDFDMFEKSKDTLKYIVIDEVHTYRGNKAGHLRFLLKRFKSIFKSKPVQIAASATLATDKYSGYIKASSLKGFINPLLDVDDFEFVEPVFIKEQQENAGKELIKNVSIKGWSVEIGNDEALKNIGAMTGNKYTEFDIPKGEESSLFRDITGSRIMNEIKEELKKGARSMLEISSIFAKHGFVDPDNYAKSFLSSVTFLNHISDNKPALDFRVHLFVRDAGGYLKKCLKCDRYHAGFQSACPDCGFPLFYVYKEDPEKCLAKVVNNRITNEIRPESTDPDVISYVLIHEAGNYTPPVKTAFMRFKELLGIKNDFLDMEYDESGKILLEYTAIKNYEQLKSHLVLLKTTNISKDFLYQISKSLLTFQTKESRKFIAFIDNRERASEYPAVFNDKFLSDFFEEVCKLLSPKELKWSMYEFEDKLLSEIYDMQNVDERDKEIFKNEFEAWFWRRILNRLETEISLIELMDTESLNEIEKAVINVFIKENAIKRNRPSLDSKIIRYGLDVIERCVGIYIDPAEKSESYLNPAISLTKDAKNYFELITKFGPDNVRDCVVKLNERGLLAKEITLDNKNHYYLLPEKLKVNFPKSGYESYKAIRDKHLFTAATHSSEIKNALRMKCEDDFKKGEINILVATPTLELGIDIGELDTVLMIGVPPLPSNYAQRAGRAGRKKNDKKALIVTFCSPGNAHDNHYFEKPEEMINGHITPPSFVKDNPEISRKHINAYIYGRNIHSQRPPHTADIAPDERKLKLLKDVFGQEAASLYDSTKETALLEKIIANYSSAGGFKEYLYKCGFFPEYSFRHDFIYIVENTKTDMIRQAPENERLLTDNAIAGREPEMAFLKFVPGEDVYMAGSLYTVTTDGKYSVIGYDENIKIRSYSFLSAEKAKKWRQSDIINRYETSVTVEAVPGKISKKDLIHIAFRQNQEIKFLNVAKRTNKGNVPFNDPLANDEKYVLGYTLNRDSLLFVFPKELFYEQSVYLSFISAMDRSIKDMLHIDETEIRVVPNLALSGRPDDLAVAIYDYDGNSNADLGAIFTNIDTVLEETYKRLTKCECKDGCYLCLKSYYSNFYASEISKKQAIMVTGYLLGKNRLESSIRPFSEMAGNFDLVFIISISGKNVKINTEKAEYKAEIENSQNKTMFELITRAINSEYKPGMKALKIRASQSYIVDAVNLCAEIDDGAEAYRETVFNFLRFKRVMGEKA